MDIKLEIKPEPDAYLFGYDAGGFVVKAEAEWCAGMAALLLAPPDEPPAPLGDLRVKAEELAAAVAAKKGEPPETGAGDSAEVPDDSDEDVKSLQEELDEKSSKKILRRRLTKETKTRPYKCEECEYTAKTLLGLKRHTKVHGEDGGEGALHQCEKCKFRTKYKSSLLYHERTHEPKEKKIFRCEKCNYQGLQAKAYTKHLLTHELPPPVFKCDRTGCTYQTNQKKHLRCHLQTHRDPETMIWWKCDQCPFKYVNERNLRVHQLKHKDPLEVEWFHCPDCPYQTRDKNCLRKHSVKHKRDDEVVWYKCEHACDFRTRRKFALRKHVVSFHDRDRQIYRCARCPFATAHKESLVPHMLLHADPAAGPWYQCGQCDYRARQRSYVNRHSKKAHKAVGFKTEDGAIEFFEDTKLYLCHHCTFETEHKTSYRDHMLLHKNPSEVEWFTCKHCSYKSMYKSNLVSHLNVHKKPSERPWFRCPQCKYKTNYKSCLTRHLALKHK